MGSRVPLQAILLADSFTTKLEPITLECPKDLLPLVNTPMIGCTLAWLESANVEEVFVLCSSSHYKQIISYLDKSKWLNKPNFSVTTIESYNCTSDGDALRLIHNLNVIKGDFILVSGDTFSNIMLTEALEKHKERKRMNKDAVMTMVIRESEPCQVGSNELIMIIDPSTKELLLYRDKGDDDLEFNKSYLRVNPCIVLHNDKEDCYIDICSPQVLGLFTDNYDYKHLRRDFVKGLLVDELVGFKIFTHEIHSSCYTARIDHEEESRHSVAPIPESNTKSGEEIYEELVETIFLDTVDANGNVGFTIEELRSVNAGFGMDRGECAGALLYSIMKLACDNSNKYGNDLAKETNDVISKWGDLLKPFSRGVHAQIQVISKFEEMCLESVKEYAPLFVKVLCILYDKGIIQEKAILKWDNEKEHADESDKVFVKQSEKFIQWLKEAEEEDREFQGH